MSKKTSSIRDPSGNGNRRPPRAHQTPLRRSPRFLSQNNDQGITTDHPTSRNKLKITSTEKTHLRFTPTSPDSEETSSEEKTQLGFSGKTQKKPLRSTKTLRGFPHGLIPRRSMRLASDSSDASKSPSTERTHLRFTPTSPNFEETSSEEKTQQGFFGKSLKKPLKLIKSPLGFPPASIRRSPRLSSNSAEATKKSSETQRGIPVQTLTKPPRHTGPRRSPRLASNSDDVTKKGVALNATVEGREVKERRRSIRLRDSVKVAEKEVGIDGLNDERDSTERERRKRDSPAILKRIEGGEEKRRKIEKNCEEKIGIGEIEKEECCGSEGWMKEQEVALQWAYLAAKPSPHFWKKVAKMVPGKSAQECFDRVHESLATPSQPRPRLRTKRPNSSPIGNFSLSDSKSSQLMVPKAKRLRSRSKNSLVAQKTVRHLLRKHCLIDQSQEADHFSVLETSPTSLAMDFPEITAPTTPDCILNPLQTCNERFSSAHQKMLLRFKTLTQANHPSPEVLKRIKNIVLHEKYVDQLHCREARRAVAKTANTVAARECKNKSELKTGELKVARTALMSEAREVISQFQQKQVNSQGNHDIDDDDDDDAAAADASGDDE